MKCNYLSFKKIMGYENFRIRSLKNTSLEQMKADVETVFDNIQRINIFDSPSIDFISLFDLDTNEFEDDLLFYLKNKTGLSVMLAGLQKFETIYLKVYIPKNELFITTFSDRNYEPEEGNILIYKPKNASKINEDILNLWFWLTKINAKDTIVEYDNPPIRLNDKFDFSACFNKHFGNLQSIKENHPSFKPFINDLLKSPK